MNAIHFSFSIAPITQIHPYMVLRTASQTFHVYCEFQENRNSLKLSISTIFRQNIEIIFCNNNSMELDSTFSKIWTKPKNW